MSKINTPEGYMLANGKAGDTFYSDKEDKNLTASATYYGRKIKTQRMIAIDSEKQNKIEKLIKVTLIK
jgi:hypothetical protein